MFKDKGHNMIDSMTVEMIVDNSQMQMFPFMFNLDRYKLGVMGSNDLAMNFNYHIAVLKSPLPFKSPAGWRRAASSCERPTTPCP